MKRFLGVIGIMVLAISCGSGSGDFTLSNATVDSNHACASGASNAPYNIFITLDSHNGRSSAVSIRTVSAVLKLAAVHGGWLQPVGYEYEAQNLAFSPDHVAAGASAKLTVTVPSACTNRSSAGGPVSYADYSVGLTVATSAGTFKIGTRNKHRIIAS
jgi:hypothetical protein